MTPADVQAHAAAGTLAAALIRAERERNAYLFDMAWLGVESIIGPHAPRPPTPSCKPEE